MAFRTLLVAILFAGASVAACSRGVDLGTNGDAGPDGGQPGDQDAQPQQFGGIDASTSPDVDPLISYCPAATCPPPLATCDFSQFLCDVDLSSDSNNCGACGHSCPQLTNTQTYCAGGTCKLQCAKGTADCNGIVDDGCEVAFGGNYNCSACGERCTDPAKPCIYSADTYTGQCGCPSGQTACAFPPPFQTVYNCFDATSDDKNCGACGKQCDPRAGSGCDGGALPPHAYYGCVGSACGHLKCDPGWADCNHDMCSDGCETDLTLPTSCATCSTKCASGQTCHKFANPNYAPQCMCPPGKILCGDSCTNLTTDNFNCGKCGNPCTNPNASGQSASGRGNVVGICEFGSCKDSCLTGWGDCNGDPSDGCETNLSADPNNCGACGKACPVVGQACGGGQCAVLPCPPGADGGLVR